MRVCAGVVDKGYAANYRARRDAGGNLIKQQSLNIRRARFVSLPRAVLVVVGARIIVYLQTLFWRSNVYRWCQLAGSTKCSQHSRKNAKKKNDTENKLKYFSPSQTPDERLQLVLRRAVPPYWVDPATLEAITGELHGLALQPCARGVGGRCRDLATLLWHHCGNILIASGRAGLSHCSLVLDMIFIKVLELHGNVCLEAVWFQFMYFQHLKWMQLIHEFTTEMFY